MARVLIVDDHPDLRMALTAVIESDGHEVVEASSGSEVEARVRETKPDLVLMDGNMPGVDGFEALKGLKRNSDTRRVPVIMVTGYNAPQERKLAMTLGADGYVTKPWGDGEIGRQISQVLTLARAS